MVAQLLQEGVHQLAGCGARNFSTMRRSVLVPGSHHGPAGAQPNGPIEGAPRAGGMRHWPVRPPLPPQASTDPSPNAEPPWRTSGSALCRDRSASRLGRASGASPGRLHPCLALLIWGPGAGLAVCTGSGAAWTALLSGLLGFWRTLRILWCLLHWQCAAWCRFPALAREPRGHGWKFMGFIRFCTAAPSPSHARGTSIHSLGRHWRTTDIPFPSSTDQLGANETPGGLGLSAFVETDTLKITITCHHRVQCH